MVPLSIKEPPKRREMLLPGTTSARVTKEDWQLRDRLLTLTEFMSGHNDMHQLGE